MRTFKVKLLRSINGAEFGSTRAEVRAVFGEDFRELKKSRFSRNTMDAYEDCHAFYTTDDRLEAVEIFPESDVLVNDQPLSRNYAEAADFIRDLDPSARTDEDGITSKELGLSLYAPGGTIESLVVAAKNYF